MEYTIKVKITGDSAHLDLCVGGSPIGLGWDGDFAKLPVGIYELVCLMEGV